MKPKDTDLVFEENGKPRTKEPSTLRRIFDRLFNGPDVPPEKRVSFHTLRHAFCSWLAQEGVPLRVIKELAGHKTIQTTMRYAHLLPDVRKKAVEAMWEKYLDTEKQQNMEKPEPPDQA